MRTLNICSESLVWWEGVVEVHFWPAISVERRSMLQLGFQSNYLRHWTVTGSSPRGKQMLATLAFWLHACYRSYSHGVHDVKPFQQ
jgi:hypothetical protein